MSWKSEQGKSTLDEVAITIREKDGSQILCTSIADARAKLTDGTGELCHQSDIPPTALVCLLEEKVADVAVLGPAVNSTKVIKRSSEGVVVSGVLQRSVDGFGLNWVSGESDLRALIETCLSAGSAHPCNLFTPFRDVLLRHVDWVSHILNSFKPLSLEAQLEKQCIPLPVRFDNRSNFATSFKKVGPEWREYYERLVTVETKLTSLIEQAFRDGCILCVAETERGDRFVHPTLADTPAKRAKLGKLHYVLSKGLPPDWFSDVAALPGRRRKAIDWIEKAGNQLAARGKRATVKQLQEIAGEKFGLSNHALEELWKKVMFQGKGTRGSIPEAQRVSLKEISEIE